VNSGTANENISETAGLAALPDRREKEAFLRSAGTPVSRDVAWTEVAKGHLPVIWLDQGLSSKLSSNCRGAVIVEICQRIEAALVV
jgi:hypothetical protein